MPRFVTSYLDPDAPCRWLRGNHHGHSTVSDGRFSPEENIRMYEEAGYDYLALSEHDRLLDVAPLQPHTALCLVPAIEVTSCYNQTLMYLGANREFPARAWTPKRIMDEVHAAGGLFIYDHPNWRPWPAYTTDDHLDALTGLRGMEIYTGVIERVAGDAKATDRWDRLLAKGWRVFGHATDDQHDRGDYFLAWNRVQWPEGAPVAAAGIVAACAEGRFYASTGVTIHTVGVRAGGQEIGIASDAEEIWWIIRDGLVVHKSSGGACTVSMEAFRRWPGVPEDPAGALYVRAECMGRGHAAAWTQPFWIEE
jgi:hypothetical protein